jgi:RNA polymerase sigma-70 factor (ECF subfamily)
MELLMGMRRVAFPEERGLASRAGETAQSASDDELMAGVGRGDGSSLNELLRRHWKAVVCYAVALVDADTAEDVAQETFLRAATHAARWRPMGTVRTYLLHIARNIALNEQRRIRNRFSAFGAAALALTGRAVPTPVEVLEESEVHAAILRAYAVMPERRREVFALIRFGGLSYRDAAALTGTSTQTIANQMSQAMADVRRAIAPYTSD